MKKSLKVLICVICIICGFIAATPDKHTTIFVVGDSTAANKGASSMRVVGTRFWRRYSRAITYLFSLVITMKRHNLPVILIQALRLTITWLAMSVRRERKVASLY